MRERIESKVIIERYAVRDTETGEEGEATVVKAEDGTLIYARSQKR